LPPGWSLLNARLLGIDKRCSDQTIIREIMYSKIS
jgi:hypothetical protein